MCEPPMQSPSPKRRLPVVGNAQEPEPSPMWWPLLGGIVILGVWVPLALVMMGLVRKWIGNATNAQASSALMLLALLLLGAFALSCVLGGALVGRFFERARPSDSTKAGLWAWSFIMLFAALGNAFRPVFVAAVVCVSLLAEALVFARLGGKWGRRKHPST